MSGSLVRILQRNNFKNSLHKVLSMDLNIGFLLRLNTKIRIVELKLTSLSMKTEAFYFYQTKVRSLSCLVTQLLTLTDVVAKANQSKFAQDIYFCNTFGS